MASPMLPIEAGCGIRQPPLALPPWRLFAFSPGAIVPASVARWRTTGGNPQTPLKRSVKRFLNGPHGILGMRARPPRLPLGQCASGPRG